MAPLKWDKIMKADLENIENDGDAFFEMLKDVSYSFYYLFYKLLIFLIF